MSVELLDGPRILEVVRRITEYDQPLGAQLRRMSDTLQYKELLNLLDSLGKGGECGTES
jgi:hypothetical protein